MANYTIEPPSSGKYTIEPPSSGKTFTDELGRTVDQSGKVLDSAGITMGGEKPPIPEENYTGAILPFRRDKEGLHWAVPEAIASPIRGLKEGGERLLGYGEKGKDPLRALSPDIFAAIGLMAGTPLTGGADKGMLGSKILEPGGRFFPKEGSDRVPNPQDASAAMAERRRAAIIERAQNIVSQKFQEGIKGGAPTVMDTIEELTKARAQGQPLTLSDIKNPELKSFIGVTEREGGPARTWLRQFYDSRNKEATARVEKLIDTHLTDESYRQTEKALIAARSEHARPIWEEASRGGSIAPLTNQFERYFNDASKAEQDAVKKVSEANSKVTLAASKQQGQKYNVYSAAAANQERDSAERELQQALAELSSAQHWKSEIKDRLRQAQEDGSANAPGAVWSPRLQQLLDHPDVRTGLREGMANESRTAVGKGIPYNPSEYAVVGHSESGEPIVGKVPNMRVLMVAKEGLDGIIASEIDQTTGRPTKRGQSFIELRNGLIDELDRLNPLYKKARDQWSGETASIKATQAGRHIFDERWFPSSEELSEKFGEMTDSDKQFFIVGVADKLKSLLYKTQDATDKGRLVNNENIRRLVRPLFKSEEEATTFLEAMERERTMKATPGELYGGSQTAGRRSDDERKAEAALHVAHGLAKVLHNNWVGAAISAYRSRRLLGGRPDPELNEAIMKLVTDPDIALIGHGETMFLRPSVPPRPAVQSSLTPPTPTSAAAHMLPGVMTGEMQDDPLGLQ